MTGITERQLAYAECRAGIGIGNHPGGHDWVYTDVESVPHLFVQHMRCARCGTRRRWKIRKRDGTPVGNTYTYPSDYSGLTLHDRQQLRLNAVRQRFLALRQRDAGDAGE